MVIEGCDSIMIAILGDSNMLNSNYLLGFRGWRLGDEWIS